MWIGGGRENDVFADASCALLEIRIIKERNKLS